MGKILTDLKGSKQLVTEEPDYLNTWVNTYTVAHPQKHCVVHPKKWDQN
jgi:hypothetical protein